MAPKFDRHTFGKADDETWIELRDFKARWPDREPPRTATMFAVFFERSAAALRTRVAGCRYVDVYEGVKPAGAWLTGGYHWLEMALAHVNESR